MAEGKKSFVLYCDQKEMFEHLPAEMCKKLLLHLFAYVNDDHPTSDDPILNALFAPIKHQLKRDLIKWESRASTSRANGALGGRPKTQTNPSKPSGLINNPEEPTEPVTVNVNGNVNDTVTVKDIKKTKGFAPPTLLEVKEYFKEKGYSDASAIKAFNYYEAGDWKDSKGQKVKSWKQKMQGVWFKDENKIGSNGNPKQTMANAFSKW